MTPTKLLISIFALVSLQLASTAENGTPENHKNGKRTVSDPVSNFFSELGDLFLDIDGTFATRTAPKVQFENNLVGQLLRPLQPQRELFNNVQENYRTIQGRLGSLIANAIIPKQNGGRQLDPLGNILSPHKGRNAKIREVSQSNTRHVNKHPQRQVPGILGSEEQVKETLERILAGTRKTGELLSTLGRPSDEMMKRLGNAAEEKDSTSEPRFDLYLRQLLRNHGNWVLENPLLRNWRNPAQRPNEQVTVTADPMPETTEDITTSTASFTTEPQTEEMQTTTNRLPELEENSENSQEPLPPMAVNYYRVDDDGNRLHEEMDIILESDPEIVELESRLGTVEEKTEETPQHFEETEQEAEEELEKQLEPRDTVILAFTEDGIPLKLRMGPEIMNPVRFLHRILRSARVTLKIPVESYDDLEPVGKEVLLLGSSSGIISRAVYLDLSNSNELKSLLRTLIRSKAIAEGKY